MRLRTNRTDSDSGTAESNAEIGQRERRGWGPFSGGQLTLIIVTVAVLLLLPVGAWAVSFTNVSITDPGGVNRAKVGSLGQLLVRPGGPLGTPFSRTVHIGDAGIAVPAGKYFRVETIGVVATITTGKQVAAEVHFKTGGHDVDLPIPVTFAGSLNGFDVYTGTVPAQFYADPQTSITLTVVSPNGGSLHDDTLTATGYLTS